MGNLPPELVDTLVDRIMQDGISSAYPFAPLVVDALLEAADVLHVTHTLAVMPDDPALGEFREEFAGMLGFIVERPNEAKQVSESFAGADKVIGSNRLFERITKSPDDRIDSKAFLKARLLDLFVGDWDRHRGQWRWATFDSKKETRHWLPIPEDRDQAFADLDGILPWIASYSFPQFVRFGGDYPKVMRLHWNARELDRRFTSNLSRDDWEEVIADLTARLSDDIIDAAVHNLPPEHYAVDGEELLSVLKQRRDGLGKAARQLYDVLAREVDIYGTDEVEAVLVEALDADRVLVELRWDDPEATTYRREFDRGETEELRIYLLGGDDRLTIRSADKLPIPVRIIGGPGDDQYTGSVSAAGLQIYDDTGSVQLPQDSEAQVNTRPYKEWEYADDDRAPEPDAGAWWRPVPWFNSGPDLGIFFGVGFTRDRYAFRKSPFSSRMTVRAGYATNAAKGRLDFHGVFHRENAKPRLEVEALFSGIEVVRYHGVGNDTELQGDDEFHRIKQEQYSFAPSLVVPAGAHTEFSFGPTFQYIDTGENEDRFISTLGDLYGTGEFGMVGARARVVRNTRNTQIGATRGTFFSLEGRVYPEIADVEETFGDVRAEAAIYLSPPSDRVTLALRAGGQRIWGEFPYFSAAFIGGPGTLRGWDVQRFAGDTSVYGNAEIRLHVSDFYFLLPGEWGIFGLADTGRVYVDGDSPGG
ncbi:MAG: BamA/TamA family outer membrane protein, partial [Thermoanaerobaculia bacterium]